MSRAVYTRRQEFLRVSHSAFTLVELMVVVAILTMLFMLLAPSLQSAVERSRISTCTSTLHHIGNALQQYVSENHDYLMAYHWREDRAGYIYYYHYPNLLAPYLGLGDCMPWNDTGQPNPKWDMAYNCRAKVFQCPSALKMRNVYGWDVSLFYVLNCAWSSQPQIAGGDWPRRMAYFPKFRDTSVAILMSECWYCYGQGSESSTQPYTTHYRPSGRAGGATGIGRNMLYADFHVTLLPTGDTPDSPMTLPWYNGAMIRRGNDMGIYFDFQGRKYISWSPLRDGQDSKGPVVGLLERG